MRKKYVGNFPELLVCGDIKVMTSCTDLARRHSVNRIGTLWLHSTYYTVVLQFACNLNQQGICAHAHLHMPGRRFSAILLPIV